MMITFIQNTQNRLIYSDTFTDRKITRGGENKGMVAKGYRACEVMKMFLKFSVVTVEHI